MCRMSAARPSTLPLLRAVSLVWYQSTVSPAPSPSPACDLETNRRQEVISRQDVRRCGLKMRMIMSGLTYQGAVIRASERRQVWGLCAIRYFLWLEWEERRLNIWGAINIPRHWRCTMSYCVTFQKGETKLISTFTFTTASSMGNENKTWYFHTADWALLKYLMTIYNLHGHTQTCDPSPALSSASASFRSLADNGKQSHTQREPI